MVENKKEKSAGSFSLPQSSASDLRSRQSVRATFKLTQKAIHALSIVAVQMGVKQKSLFDYLIEDMESLGFIARTFQPQRFKKKIRVQKTYVISRKTLSFLDQAAKEFNVPRDALVEFSVKRLLPMIAGEEQRHQRRKEILQEFLQYLQAGEYLLHRAGKLLGEDDPVCLKLEALMSISRSTGNDIEAFIEKGKIIEIFLSENFTED